MNRWTLLRGTNSKDDTQEFPDGKFLKSPVILYQTLSQRFMPDIDIVMDARSLDVAARQLSGKRWAVGRIENAPRPSERTASAEGRVNYVVPCAGIYTLRTFSIPSTNPKS